MQAEMKAFYSMCLNLENCLKMFEGWTDNFSPARQETVFQKQDIDLLKDTMFRKHTKRREKPSGTIHFMFNNADIQWAIEKLDFYNEEIKFDGNFYITPHPYLPHSDITTKELLPKGYKPYKTVLIPLMAEPSKQPNAEIFSLVVFNERYIGWGKNFVKNNGLVTDTWATDNNYSSQDFVCGERNKVTKSDFKKYFSHLNYESFDSFSIENIFPYEIGTAMIFDSCQVHASVNHITQGGIYKCGLNITTYVPTYK
jgi:hypothetical protein